MEMLLIDIKYILMKCIIIIVWFFLGLNGYSQKVRTYLTPENFYSKIIVDTCCFNFDTGSFEDFNFPSNDRQFDSVSISDIDGNWLKYKNKIIEISKQKHLDYHSLIKAFEIIKNESSELGLLPIAAYLATKGKTDVWVIICKWEIKKDLVIDSVDHYYGWYGHIRKWAIETNNYKIIGFSSCE